MIDDHDEKEFVALIDRLVAELAPGSAIGFFERAGARDSTGHPDLAVPLYMAALNGGLVGERRRRAIIQLASSLRNLGNPQEAVALLTAEPACADEPPAPPAATGFAAATTTAGPA